MIDTSNIQQRLQQLGFDPEVLKRYEESHRFYHTLSHLDHVLNYLEKKGQLNDDLFLTAVYHDAVYDPKSKDNEEKSAELFVKHAQQNGSSNDRINAVRQYILDTKTYKASSEKSQQFIDADLDILQQPLGKLIEHEKQIFKEYQFVDYRLYQARRIEVLRSFNQKGNLDPLIEYVNQRMPMIGVFAGSFNPFHKGHYNVLQKAERIFDKVIIAFGQNPDKNTRGWKTPESIKNRQIEEYSGLLTDFINTIDYEVTVIRGLRNSTDFQYEQNQYRYIQELKPDIRIVNIFCDKEFEHISSSGIRTLEKYNKHQSYLLD